MGDTEEFAEAQLDHIAVELDEEKEELVLETADASARKLSLIHI